MCIPVADFVAETGMLDAEATGAYHLLLIHMWINKGALPNNDEVLRRCARLGAKRWRVIKPKIWSLFVETGQPIGSEITHARLRREWDRAFKKSVQAAANGSLGGRMNALKRNQLMMANAGRSLPQNEYQKRGSDTAGLADKAEPPIPKQKDLSTVSKISEREDHSTSEMGLVQNLRRLNDALDRKRLVGRDDTVRRRQRAISESQPVAATSTPSSVLAEDQNSKPKEN